MINTYELRDGAGVLLNTILAKPEDIADFIPEGGEAVFLRGPDMTIITRDFRDAVNAERTKRVTKGTDVEVTDYGLVALQGRPEDQSTLQGLAFAASLRLSQGDITTTAQFLDRNNVLHHLTPRQMVEAWEKGAAFIEQVYAASWQIKEMDPIETDPKDDSLWP